MPRFVDLVETERPAPDALQARLFAGDIVLFRQFGPVKALVAQADRMVRAHFPEAAPERLTDAIAPDPFIERAAALRRVYGEDPAALALWRQVLAACGLVPERTYWDRMRLRINPPGSSHHSRRILNLPAHRDSWGSMLPQQINWWAPLYPVSAGRTLLIYPEAWDRPVSNDSADWDLEELKRRRAAGTPGDYPLLPTAREPGEWGAAVPLLPEPGDIVAFSAAHLHASAVNETGLCRLNVEGRTLDAVEWRAGRGAPDPDGRAPRIAHHWFTHCESERPLAPGTDG